MNRRSSSDIGLVLLAVLLLSACGNSEPQQNESQPPTVAPSQSQPVASTPAATPASPTITAQPPATSNSQPAPTPTLQPAAPTASSPPAATTTNDPPIPLAPLPATEAAVPDADGNYVGIAEVVEGDVIRIGATRFLLYGIDTVERPQLCEINGQPWQCWAAAARQLQTIVGEGAVTCKPVREPDVFGRLLSLCEIDGESVNARMVSSGFAVVWADEMPEYLPLQEEARAAGIGLWQGTFEMPQNYREGVGMSARRP